MRSTNLILAIAALAGVAFLYVRDDGRDSRDDAIRDLSVQLSELRTEVAALSRDIGRLEERTPDEPKLLGAGPTEREAVARLSAKVETLEGEMRARLEAQDKRLADRHPPPRATAPSAPIAPKPGEVEGWLKRLEHEDEDIVFSATIELARLGDLRATEPLIKVLKTHKDFYGRLGAATALGQIKAAAAVPDLIDGLMDKDDLVRTASAEALHVITNKDFNFVSGLSANDRERIQQMWRRWWGDNEADVTARLERERAR